MRRESVVRVAEKVMRLCGGVTSDPSGINVRRIYPGGGYDAWRLRSGGGIAGNSGVWWLAPVGVKVPEQVVRGPFRTVRELERELRAWKRWDPWTSPTPAI